jgi:hypothetical protein
MSSWKGFFTEKEAWELINCIETYNINAQMGNNIDNLKSAINKALGDHPMRDTLLLKIEDLHDEQIVEIINAAKSIARETAYTSSKDLKYRDDLETKMEDLINSVFNPQEE